MENNMQMMSNGKDIIKKTGKGKKKKGHSKMAKAIVNNAKKKMMMC